MLHSLVPAFAQAHMDESYGLTSGSTQRSSTISTISTKTI